MKITFCSHLKVKDDCLVNRKTIENHFVQKIEKGVRKYVTNKNGLFTPMSYSTKSLLQFYEIVINKIPFYIVLAFTFPCFFILPVNGWKKGLENIAMTPHWRRKESRRKTGE